MALPLLFVGSSAWAQDAVTLVSAAGYGTLEAGGVVVTVSGDVNKNAAVALEWRTAGAGSFRVGHPLSRVDATHFVGSLFWLQPGTTYEARVTLSDPEGVSGSATAVATVQTRADSLPEPSLRTLYVSPSGSDLNPGTSSSAPLRTIQRAADLAQAGDLVRIQPGVYRESVTVRRSGTASQPVVFRGDGPGAILDGADAAIDSGVAWTSGGGGVYSYLTGFATGHVVSDQGRLYSYASVADLQTLGAGAPGGFYFDGTRLHVKFADGGTPTTHAVHAARFEDGFLVNGLSFVRIENLEIRHFGASDYGKGVYLRYSSDCTVKGNRIHDVGSAGVWLKGGDRHLVEDNEIWDTSISGWPWPLTKGSSAENDGVLFSDAIGRGNVVRRNTIHGTFNGIVPCGSAAPASGFSNETDVYDNLFYEHNDDGLEPEGYCANVRIWGNRIRDVHMAVAAAPAAPGPLYVVRNVAWRVGNTRTSQQDGYTASALKINSGYATPIGPLFLYHNTFLTDVLATDAIALMNPGYSTFIRARNNVVAATRYVLSKVNPVAWDGDGDLLYTTDPTRFVSWMGTRYATLAAYQGIGQEAHGLSAPPRLVDPAGGDFEPEPGSPLVDAGMFLPGINDDFQGTAPDVGAIESAGSLPTLSVGNAQVTEGNSGTKVAQFVVSLSAGTDVTVTVNYATADGTAKAGTDYGAASGVLTFSPGSLQRTIDVSINGDATVEPDESFLVNLSGASRATVADGQGQGTIVNDDVPPPTEAVAWTSAVGVTVSGNSLSKTAATAWGNSGAVSTKSLPSGDGYVELTASETNTRRILGLSNGDSNPNWNDVDFGLYLNSNKELRIYERGVYRGAFGTYAPGNVLRVSVESGTVKYYRNGTLFYTSTVRPTYPLLVDAALYTKAATITGAVIAGSWSSPPAVPPAGEGALWTNAAGVLVTGNSLSKTAVTKWGNAGAVSTKFLPSGNGYVEFRVTETNLRRILGLSNGDTNVTYSDVDFGLYLNLDGLIKVYEKGSLRGTFGAYATGDILRVSVEAGVVTYRRNGTLFYTSKVAPTYPLLVDTALYSVGATLTNVVVSGAWR
jgi:parallel beta-helix repeat protein